MRRAAFGSSPLPLSSTDTTTSPPSTAALKVIVPCGGVCFAAFLTSVASPAQARSIGVE